MANKSTREIIATSFKPMTQYKQLSYISMVIFFFFQTVFDAVETTSVKF